MSDSFGWLSKISQGLISMAVSDVHYVQFCVSSHLTGKGEEFLLFSNLLCRAGRNDMWLIQFCIVLNARNV